MLFLIDESGNFVFNKNLSSKDNKLPLALVCGIAVSQEAGQNILSYMHSNFSKDNQLLKGSTIQDEQTIEAFIDKLSNENCYGTFTPGDHGNISLENSNKYRNDFVQKWNLYASQSHPEYEYLSEKQQSNLLKKVSDYWAEAEKLPPQDFCKMLMILETIEKLLRKFLNKLNNLKKEFDGIDIIIDTQNPSPSKIINNGLLYYFLFVATRENPLDYKQENLKKIEKYLNGKYLDITKLIRIKITSDTETPLLYIPDYMSNFTRRTLRDDIQSRGIVDKLSEFYKCKEKINQFHPTEEFIDTDVPLTSEYAIEKLIDTNPI